LKVFFTLQNAYPAKTSKQSTQKTAKNQDTTPIPSKTPEDSHLKSSI